MSNFNAFLFDHGINPADEKIAIPDVFVNGRIYANDRDNESSMEIFPSWANEVFKIPPHIAVCLLPEQMQHFHEWGATPVSYVRINFTRTPFYKEDGNFLTDLKS